MIHGCSPINYCSIEFCLGLKMQTHRHAKELMLCYENGRDQEDYRCQVKPSIHDLNQDFHTGYIWFSMSVHSENRNVVVAYS